MDRQHEPTREPRPTRGDRSPSLGNVFDVLADERCRTIIAAVADAELTAKEIAESCDIPLSTVYRKVDGLETAGLVDAFLRIDRFGNHCQVYSCSARELQVQIDPEDGFDLTLDAEPPAAADHVSRHAHGD